MTMPQLAAEEDRGLASLWDGGGAKLIQTHLVPQCHTAVNVIKDNNEEEVLGHRLE